MSIDKLPSSILRSFSGYFARFTAAFYTLPTFTECYINFSLSYATLLNDSRKVRLCLEGRLFVDLPHCLFCSHWLCSFFAIQSAILAPLRHFQKRFTAVTQSVSALNCSKVSIECGSIWLLQERGHIQRLQKLRQNAP